MKKNILKKSILTGTLALTLCTAMTGCGVFGGSAASTSATTHDEKSSGTVQSGSDSNRTAGSSYSEGGNMYAAEAEEAWITEDAAEADEAWDGGYSLYAAEAVAESGMWFDAGNYGWNTETYEKKSGPGFQLTAVSPLSTFSASVDSASYANVRRMIEDGYSLSDIPADAVRAEEFINYFSYDLNAPARGEKFGITTELAACPWNENHKLLFTGIRTEDIDMSERPDSNLVFLIDVSGSMSDDNKLPLLQKSFKQLAENLTARDRVSIVTYASGIETVLDSASGDEEAVITDALDSLYASGGTNGEGGIQRAYEIAERNFIEGGVNRVVVATDGDFNIGLSDPDALQRMIEEKRDSGIYLSLLGFGMGNYQDATMERLANYGNGNYAYIDSLLEAKKVLVEEMGSTLVTVADDVKLQVEFNPARVNAYRLIGYENRMLNASDFNDDTKDAGEIGAGHAVVALFEIIETGSEDQIELKYGDNAQQTEAADSNESEAPYADEYATIKIRYKEPGKSTSELVEAVITEDVLTEEPSENIRFASLAAEFAMVLENNESKGTATLDTVLEGLKQVSTDDEYKNEFYYLVRKLSGRG